jgi:hypothetical protein
MKLISFKEWLKKKKLLEGLVIPDGKADKSRRKIPPMSSEERGNKIILRGTSGGP